MSRVATSSTFEYWLPWSSEEIGVPRRGEISGPRYRVLCAYNNENKVHGTKPVRVPATLRRVHRGMGMQRLRRRGALACMGILVLFLGPELVLASSPITPRPAQSTPFVVLGDEAHYQATGVTHLIDVERGDVRTWTSPGFDVDLGWKVVSASEGLYHLNVSYTAGPPASISRDLELTLDPLVMNVTGPRSPPMHSFLWTLPGRHTGEHVLLGGNSSTPISGQVTGEGNQRTVQGTQPVFVVDARIVEFLGHTFPLSTAFDSDIGLNLGYDFNTDGAFFQAGFIYANQGFSLLSTNINLGPANWAADVVYFLGMYFFAILLLGAAGIVAFYFVRKWRRTDKETVADRVAQKRRRSHGRGHGKS